MLGMSKQPLSMLSHPCEIPQALVPINMCREMQYCLGLLHNNYEGEALEKGIFALVISSFPALILMLILCMGGSPVI